MNKIAVVFFLSIVLAVLFFGLTNPENMPIAFLMVPILLVFIIASSGVYLMLSTVKVIIRSPRHRKIVSILSGVIAAFMVIFQSTGGIVAGDLVLMTIIVFVVYLYMTKY